MGGSQSATLLWSMPSRWPSTCVVTKVASSTQQGVFSELQDPEPSTSPWSRPCPSGKHMQPPLSPGGGSETVVRLSRKPGVWVVR